jgi:hypothetical protein
MSKLTEQLLGMAQGEVALSANAAGTGGEFNHLRKAVSALVLTGVEFQRTLDSAQPTDDNPQVVPDPSQGGAALSRASELIEIGELLDRSLREALPADDGWMLVYEARDRVKALIDAKGAS